MNVRDMTAAECKLMLAANRFGHLGCVASDRPYVVPIRYVFKEGAFYSFSLPGKKIDCLRANPRACIQIENLTTEEEWQSVLVEGLYRELPDDEKWHGQHIQAWSLLQECGNWWEPGAYKPDSAVAADPELLPVFYSLEIETLSGRHATNS